MHTTTVPDHLFVYSHCVDKGYPDDDNPLVSIINKLKRGISFEGYDMSIRITWRTVDCEPGNQLRKAGILFSGDAGLVLRSYIEQRGISDVEVYTGYEHEVFRPLQDENRPTLNSIAVAS